MRRIGYRLFQGGLFIISLLLLFTAYHYRISYWLGPLNLTRMTSLALRSRILFYMGQGLCLLSAVFLFLFRKKIYKKRREVLLFLISLIICLSFLELGSRVYLCNFADAKIQSTVLLYNQCGITSTSEPHHYLNYHGTPNYKSADGLNIHNSYGFRGPEIEVPKPKYVYRIVTLGGSTTYTTEVKDWKKDFARQLQRELQNKYDYTRIEVINAGLGAWSSWESLINLEFQVLDLEPNLIIIYHGTNDVHPRLVNPEYYRGDNSGRRKQWKVEPIPIVFYSTFVRLLTRINPSGVEQFVNVPTAAALTRETGFISNLNGTALETLQKNKPIYFERNLRNMIAIAKEHDISVLLSTWAYNIQVGDYISTPHYQVGLEETNEVVKKVGESHGVSVYDFASEMPIDKIYWADGRHLNEEGVELKGRLFANYIYSNKIIEDKIMKLKNAK